MTSRVRALLLIYLSGVKIIIAFYRCVSRLTSALFEGERSYSISLVKTSSSLRVFYAAVKFVRGLSSMYGLCRL